MEIGIGNQFPKTPKSFRKSTKSSDIGLLLVRQIWARLLIWKHKKLKSYNLKIGKSEKNLQLQLKA